MYPADDFHMVKKYGQTVLVTQDLALENYLEKCVDVASNYGTVLTRSFRVPLSQDIEASER